MSDALDLTGEWRGIFNYPAGLPPTEFLAVLVDAGGALSGEIVETAVAGPCAGGEIRSRIDGRRDGAAVAFAKLYDADEAYDSVAYRGEVSPEGDEISGRWTIPGQWSGSFIMLRPRGLAAAEERRAEAPVG